jgi:hypothetical protein
VNEKMTTGALALIAGLGISAAACTTVTNQPSSPTSTITRPAPTATASQPPAPATAGSPAPVPASRYAQDITNAGIVAPVDWINRTGEQLCSDWRNGMTTASTNRILLAGGLHADHLDEFNHITNSDLCPDASPLFSCAGGTHKPLAGYSDHLRGGIGRTGLM